MDVPQLPNFMNYKDRFSDKGFVEKVQCIAKRAGVKLVYIALILFYTLKSNKVSLKDKTLIIGALGYLISPLDVVPDAIPIAGLGDDLGVLLYVLNRVWVNVDEDIKAEALNKMKSWFDEDELKNIDSVLEKEDPVDVPV